MVEVGGADVFGVGSIVLGTMVEVGGAVVGLVVGAEVVVGRVEVVEEEDGLVVRIIEEVGLPGIW